MFAKASTGSLVVVNVKEEEENDLIPVDILEKAEGNTATRLLQVPTNQLLLTQGVTEHKDTVDFTFIDGEFYTLEKNKRSLEASKAITLRMVKVPTNKILKNASSPEWLEKVVFGFPLPVTVGEDTLVRLLDGTDTGYRYKSDCGVYKPKTLD